MIRGWVGGRARKKACGYQKAEPTVGTKTQRQNLQPGYRGWYYPLIPPQLGMGTPLLQ